MSCRHRVSRRLPTSGPAATKRAASNGSSSSLPYRLKWAFVASDGSPQGVAAAARRPEKSDLKSAKCRFESDWGHVIGACSGALSVVGSAREAVAVRKFLLLMNPIDVESCGITSWRAGVSHAAGKIPEFDFIVNSNAPAYLSDEVIGFREHIMR